MTEPLRGTAPPPPRPVAALFLRAQHNTPPPEELGPIPLEQQRMDVQKMCQHVGIGLGLDGSAAWPSPPTTAGPPTIPPSRWGPWRALSPTRCLRVSVWHRLVPWEGEQRNHYLLIAVVAARLPGWDYAAHRWYPKRTVPFFRRAAWLLRNLGRTHPMYGRLMRALNLNEDVRC